jgi:hypothetical protein
MTRLVARLGALAGAVMISMAAAAPALAQDEDLASLKAEVEQMKADYEARISSLEDRLAAAETRAANAEHAQAGAASPANADAATESTYADAEQATSQDQPVDIAASDETTDVPADEPVNAAAASANLMNPGISVVLNGQYFADGRDPESQRVSGFELGEEAGLPDRGFSLGESEVTLAANIDPYFYGALTVAFTNDSEAEVEEAYLRTTALPGGFTLKGGRFFSGIGYLNERHAHSWLFSDMPLPYRAFLGGQYGDDGLLVRWIAPTTLFVEVGAEGFRGDRFPAGNAADHGAGTWTLFAHSGSDINDSWSWLAGASWLHSEADARETHDPVNGLDLFSGDSDVGILSFVAKWAPYGNPIQRNFAFNAEYFLNTEGGRFNGVSVDLDRSGWYAQGVYQFMPRWSVGLRYSALRGDDPGLLLAGSTLDRLGHNPWNASALVEYDTSEFTRLRLQYTRDESDLQAADQLLFQFTATYGPHDAHRY